MLSCFVDLSGGKGCQIDVWSIHDGAKHSEQSIGMAIHEFHAQGTGGIGASQIKHHFFKEVLPIELVPHGHVLVWIYIEYIISMMLSNSLD